MGWIEILGFMGSVASLWDATPLVSTIEGYNTFVDVGEDAALKHELAKKLGIDCQSVWLTELGQYALFVKNENDLKKLNR